jgi:hypothetical protein
MGTYMSMMIHNITENTREALSSIIWHNFSAINGPYTAYDDYIEYLSGDDDDIVD